VSATGGYVEPSRDRVLVLLEPGCTVLARADLADRYRDLLRAINGDQLGREGGS
jgi:hypothetical protein